MKTHVIIPAIRESHFRGHVTEVYFALLDFSYIESASESGDF